MTHAELSKVLAAALREAMQACELFSDSNNTCADAVLAAHDALKQYDNTSQGDLT